ncbi:MAG: hypothetical protein BVN33_08750 [Proteobacteria bacterium ST_bin13]|nr:MAG: hypothetical protein BVN33_08750 [Proteobacteria bacterium ST_bin13]
MTESSNDALLLSGKLLAKLLQGASALAGGIVLFFIPVVVLLSHDMLPGLGGANKGGGIEASPVSAVAILTLMSLILAALFQFFGKLRAIIVSAGEGDPFTPENAKRLNVMAWLFLGVKILAVIVGGLRFYVVNLVDKGADNGNWPDFSIYDLDAVLIVIVLFILARIFRHGAAMRADLKGTV